MNQCIRLTQSLNYFSNYRPVEEVKLALTGIASVIGNLRLVEKFNNLRKLFKVLYNWNLTKLIFLKRSRTFLKVHELSRFVSVHFHS